MKTTRVILLFIFLINTSITAEDDWIQMNPNQNPGNSSGHAVAYISDGKVLFTDGSSWAQFNETWIYDFNDNAWTQMNPVTKPDSRWLHKLSYIGEDRTILFSGDRFGLEDLNDTWTYDLSDNTWTQMNPQNSPNTRYAYGLTHIGDDKALLFGGQVSSQVWNDLWVYDYSENNWTKKYPNVNPSGRYGPAMCYLGNDKVLLFGGMEFYGNLPNDTWIYDLSDNTWTQMNPPKNPPGRHSHDLAYIGNGRALLFGGEDEDINYFNDTWIFDLTNNTWMEDLNNTNPPARSYHQLSVNNINNPTRAILFGGDLNFSDTWLFGGGDYRLDIHEVENFSTNKIKILHAYPNPFNPLTIITFELPRESEVSIKIYNSLGNEVKTIINDFISIGLHQVSWDSTDNFGEPVSAGTYFCQLIAEDITLTIKMVLIR